jgi:type 1 fimbria pilin
MPLIKPKTANVNDYPPRKNMMTSSIHRLLRGATLAASCMAPLAMANNCSWNTGGPAMMNYQRNLGTLYIPRDARVGSVIGTVDMNHSTPNNAGLVAECRNDGTKRLMFNARATAPIFPGPLDPINGEDLTGKVLQTNIPGVGVRIKLGFPLNGGEAHTAFFPIGPPTVPYDGFNDKNLLVPIRLNSLVNQVTLVKTGPLAPGPQALDGSELFSGHFPDLGKVFGYGMIGTVIAAQCSVGANPVSADPVPLGDWDSADFTGPGYSTRIVPFNITLSQCETDPGAGFVAMANIRLEGILGSAPIGPTTNGIFSLTTDSTAKGMGIQILKGDGITPVELATEVPLMKISPGTTVLDFNARFYQTEPATAVRPGLAKGALSFTLTYK